MLGENNVNLNFWNIHLDAMAKDSANRYRKVMANYNEYCLNNAITNKLSGDSIYTYLNHLHETDMAPTTISTILSIIGRYFDLVHKIDLEGENPMIRNTLSLWSKNHTKKQARIFSLEEFHRYINIAPDDHKHLPMKVAAIIEVNCSMRLNEAHNLVWNNISLGTTEININFKRSKINQNQNCKIIDPIQINKFKTYVNCFRREDQNGRFFRYLNVTMNGTKANIGENSLGRFPSKIAKFLGLENPDEYTSHSFRRSSATMLVENGATLPQLKQHGGWKSDSAANVYIVNSSRMQTQTAAAFATEERQTENTPSDSNKTIVQIHNSSNVNVTIYPRETKK
jgi:site-specific recombinase XerD